MASRPDFTENAVEPLGSDELAGDAAQSPQGNDPLDDDGFADDGELAGDEDVVTADETLLPPD